MNALEELLNRRLINRKTNPELYYRVRDGIGQYNKFIHDKLGYSLTINNQLIKLNKIPGCSESWMGIQEFDDPFLYQLFCSILMFLEEKELDEQFILSNLTEYIYLELGSHKIDWTIHRIRRQLVKVLKYCFKEAIIEVNDGNTDNFISDGQYEVLYQNTGISRFWMNYFYDDVTKYTSYLDFEKHYFLADDITVGIARSQSAYRKLLLSPGAYKDGDSDPIFEYIRQYHDRIESDINKYFENIVLHVHLTSAYIVASEGGHLGHLFPENNGLSDAILLLNQKICDSIDKKKIIPDLYDFVYLDFNTLEVLTNEVYDENQENFAKGFRDLSYSEFNKLIVNKMVAYSFIEIIDEYTVKIFPIVGKMIGHY